ncbi:helix-turn-helix domain-containing protein [Streptomyces milbemycinicus]|uniref:Helix-turn-helix transcriptional regulator n=1 Tax=Streptomyces milbemycinicus TaxID=476552 RepID=A0ABW8LEP5_9ACTN
MALRSQPTAFQARLGSELRKMREAAGMTAREAAERVGTTSAQMSHVESGRAGISAERVRQMATQYACLDEELIAELVAMATDRSKGWWEEFRGVLAHRALDLAELEYRAASLHTFEGAYIPGLLQIEDYTRDLMSYGIPQPSPQLLETLVTFRLRRRAALTRDSPPAYHVVIHEAALRTRVSTRQTARKQLDFLLEQSERLNNTIRVIPFDTDRFGGAGNPLLYASGPVPKLDTVYIDAPHGPGLLDAESQLVRYRALLDKAATFALSSEKSRDFIHSIAQEL